MQNKVFLFFFFIILYLTLGISKASALVVDRFDQAPPLNAQACFTDSCSGIVGDFCFNSETVNVTSCGAGCNGGSTWTKYEYSACLQEDIDLCGRYFNNIAPVCSTGDKCIPGEQGLRSGSCTCGNFSSSVYKYCCTPSGNPEACNNNAAQDPYDPDEGVCPGGYIVDGNRVRDSSCVPIIILPSPTPTPQGPSCTCTYPESCDAGSGAGSGNRSCNGVSSAGSCVFDGSGACSSNCTPCTPNEEPVSTPTPTPTCGPPTDLSGACDTTQDPPRLTFDWTESRPWCQGYAIRVDDKADSWGNDNPLPNDTVNNNASTPFIRPGILEHDYDWWMHAVSPGGEYTWPESRGERVS